MLLINVLLISSPALAAGDPMAGEKVFASHCAVCHATTPGENKIGPSLAGIAGSKSGTIPAFDFSPAMKNANVSEIWTPTNSSDNAPALSWITNRKSPMPGPNSRPA